MISDDAAYAENWKTVLAVDGLMGAAVAAVGVFLLARSNIVIGALLMAAGATYVVLVARRAIRWRTIRDDAGLP